MTTVSMRLAFAVVVGSVLCPSRTMAEGAWRDVCVSVRGATHDEPAILSATIALTLARMRLTMVDAGSSRESHLSHLSRSPCWATVSLEYGEATGTRVLVHSEGGALLLDRTLRDPSAEIQREQVADAVRGAIEAQLLAEEDARAGGEPRPVPSSPTPAESVAATAKEPPRDERPRPPSPWVPTKFALDVSVLVASGPVASTEGLVTRVGAAAALASRQGLRPSIVLSGLYAFPLSAGDDLVAAQVKLGSVRLLGTLQPARWSWGAFDVGAGGGVDVLSVEPASKLLPATVLAGPTTHVDPVVSGMATLRVSMAPNVVFSLSAMLDVDVVTHQYVLDHRSERDSVLSLWTFRPMLVAGLSFTALGSSPFPRSSP